MERCPACRARLGDSPICPRCACDFTHAARAEARAANLARRAIQAWFEGDASLAHTCINASLALKRGPLAVAVAAMLRSRAQAEGA